jgi:hypothetical protein
MCQEEKFSPDAVCKKKPIFMQGGECIKKNALQTGQ